MNEATGESSFPVANSDYHSVDWLFMSEIEIPEDYEELKAWYLTKEQERLERVSKVPTLAEELSKQRKAEEELRKQLANIVANRRKIEDEQAEIRRKNRADEVAMHQAKRKLDTFASERAIQERLAKEAEEFDAITQQHMWREFAFTHQIEGAKRLASARRGILGDKRGLGKSLTSLIWADMLKAKRVLVFAPKDVLENFKREINHWTPHRNPVVIGGMNKIQRETFLPMLTGLDQWLVLCNYEAWRRDATLIEYIKDLQADTVIIDEAHNIKEKKTSAYKGIRDIVYAENKCNVCGGTPEPYNDGLATIRHGGLRCSKCLNVPAKFGDFCSVKNVLPMTGTAILNKPQDLWTLLNLVDRVLFPSESAFLHDYCETNIFTGRWQFRAGGEDALIEKLGSKFVKRDKKSAGVKFKEQVIVPHYIDFDKTLYPDQWKIIQQIKEFGAIKMGEDVKLDVIGVLPDILRRRQAITWPAGIKIWEYAEGSDGVIRKTGRALYEAPAAESIKMDKCMEIAEQIIFEEEDRLVIFSQFKEALKELERRFNSLGISVVRYDGDISDNMANQAQLDFDGKTAANHPYDTECNPECRNWDGGLGCTGYKWQVILCHYKKGGVGLNLNAASQMIILDREWNPGKEDQAQGRIDRLDNLKDSVVHTIHVDGSIDMFMDSLIEEKKNMIDAFESSHDTLERMLEALRNDDLL